MAVGHRPHRPSWGGRGIPRFVRKRAGSPCLVGMHGTLDDLIAIRNQKPRDIDQTGEFGWGGTPVTSQRRRPEALLRWNRNLPWRRRPKALLMLRLSVRVPNVQVWPSDPLVKCTSSGYRSQRCQKNYHRDNWLVAAKRSKRRCFLILRCRLFLASHPQPSRKSWIVHPPTGNVSWV